MRKLINSKLKLKIIENIVVPTLSELGHDNSCAPATSHSASQPANQPTSPPRIEFFSWKKYLVAAADKR